MKIGFIGLGIMGESMCENIVKKHNDKVFACDRGEEFGAMFLMYDNAVPILLVWYSDAGAVAISASFLPDDALNACASAEEVSAWLTTRGLPRVAVEEVQYK